MPAFTHSSPVFVERLLQINIATLVALASLLVGIGQQSTLMPLGMMVAAMLSVWLTDHKGWLALNRTAAGLASIGALALAMPKSLRLEKTTLILAIAELLVYLQVIHLFQRKRPGVYWALIRFSVLQVVVAALLVQGVLFGMILVAYLFTALGALALLFLHCERTAQRGSAGLSPPRPGLRWPLARQVPEAAIPTPGRPAVQPELFWRLARLGVGTLVLSALVFLIVPRIGAGAWSGAGSATRQTVGFSDQVMLGELGKVIQNPQEVLRIWFFDATGQQPYEVQDEVYLRGAVLTEYQQGNWRPPTGRWDALADCLAPRSPEPDEPVVRQRIRIEPTDRNEVFCVWPFLAIQRQEGLAFDTQTGRLVREGRYARKRFTFELGTTAFDQGRQSPIYPNREYSGAEAVALSELLQMPYRPGGPALPSLVDQARRWLAKAPYALPDRVARARYLEQQLRDSGQFRYSLKGQNRDPQLDPIEDFIANNPRGHCEYFATALTLMLRSQGIPARMIVGYRTGQWNDLGGFFQVRQLHAHTWVEAYLGPEDLPPGLRQAGQPEQWNQGAWLRLDPTPAADQTELASLWRLWLDQALDWLEGFWTGYVFEMDRSRQRQAVYEPLRKALQQFGQTVTDPGWWRRQASGLLERLGLVGWVPAGLRGVIVWAVPLSLAAALALAGYAAYRFVRTRASLRPGGRPSVPGTRTQIEFYRRFEAILARWGLVRPAGRTQREFAVWVGSRLGEQTADPRLAALPVQVAEAFYQVRFGGAALDKPQLGAIEGILAELQRAVRGSKA